MLTATRAFLLVSLALRPALAEDIKPWYSTAIDDDKSALSISIDGNRQTLYAESHALLIGEVNYTEWPRLVAIPGELALLTKALERQHFKVDVYFDLTSETMMQVIDQFIKTRGAVSESRLLIYIAAHGYSRDIRGRRLGYLLPIDTPKSEFGGCTNHRQGAADAHVSGLVRGA